MSRSLRSERGGVVVLAAVMIPVFLLLTALVFDVGDWYTHKRQLQNRADAAAFSAGIEYQKNWKACVQNGDPALKLATAQKIANAARQYAGDPQASDYAPATMPTPVNTELANQSKVDVVINSTSHTNDTDNSDGGGALNTVAGSPCYAHAADDISAAGYWTDVKVKEKDLPSLVGTIGLPLSQNLARARIEIRPATSGHRFLPLAVPDFEITRVQVRYFDECRDPNHNSPLATKDLAPLPVPEQHDYIASGGGTLWTLPVPGSNPPVGDKSLSFGLTIPVYQGGSGACGSAQYLPVGVEVRIASRDEVDFNQSCATLRNNVKFADCFSRLSQIRVYNDGNPDNQVRITNVRLSGGCPTPGDAYFATLPFGLTTCPYDVSAEVNWGNRDAGCLECSGELPRHGERRRHDAPVRKPDGRLDDIRRRSAGIRGREHRHSGCLVGRPESGSRLSGRVLEQVLQQERQPVQVFGQPGDPSGLRRHDGQRRRRRARADVAVATRRRRPSRPAARQHRDGRDDGHPRLPGSDLPDGRNAFDAQGRRADDPPPRRLAGEPDSGVRSGDLERPGVQELRHGLQAVVREEPVVESLVGHHDPNVSERRSLVQLDRDVRRRTASTPRRIPGSASSSRRASRRARSATGSRRPRGTADNIGNNKCQAIDCNVDGNYDGKTGSPNGWLQDGGDSRDPRVVGLFIVPYQALKGAAGGSGSQVVPILGFASFYVMNWTGPSRDSDPCPDKTLGHRQHPTAAQVGGERRLRRDRRFRCRPRRSHSHVLRGPADAVQGCSRPLICR